MRLRDHILELLAFGLTLILFGMCQHVNGQEFTSSRYEKKYRLLVDSVIYAGVNSGEYEHRYKRFAWEEHQWELSPNEIPAKEGEERRLRGFRICKECYRKESIHDTVWYERLKTSYDLLDERVKELMKCQK